MRFILLISLQIFNSSLCDANHKLPADSSQAMADDDSWLYGEDNDEVEESEAAVEEVEAVKGDKEVC